MSSIFPESVSRESSKRGIDTLNVHSSDGDNDMKNGKDSVQFQENIQKLEKLSISKRSTKHKYNPLKHFFIQISMYQLWFVVIMATAAVVSPVNGTAYNMYPTEANCRAYRTSAWCNDVPTCTWSTSSQSCDDNGSEPSDIWHSNPLDDDEANDSSRTECAAETGHRRGTKTWSTAVFAGQRFEGIASGGTRMRVRGRRLTNLANPSIYVVGRDGVRYEGPCLVKSDSCMECRSPKVEGPAPPPGGEVLPFGFLGLAAGPDGHSPFVAGSYALFPDPVAADFDVDGRTVIVHGRNLDRGYAAQDLSVHMPGTYANGVCNVIHVAPRRIVCRLFSEPPERSEGQNATVVMTVGDRVQYELGEKPATARPSTPSRFAFSKHSIFSSFVCAFVASLVLWFAAVVAVAAAKYGFSELQKLCAWIADLCARNPRASRFCGCPA